MITKILLLIAIPTYYPLQLVGFIAGFLVAPLMSGYYAGYTYIYNEAREQWTKDVTDEIKGMAQDE